MLPEAPERKPTFTLAEINALRLLALTLGAVACGLFTLQPSAAGVMVTLGLMGAMAGAIALALYVLRRRKSGP
jgi:hypothetical protein